MIKTFAPRRTQKYAEENPKQKLIEPFAKVCFVIPEAVLVGNPAFNRLKSWMPDKGIRA